MEKRTFFINNPSSESLRIVEFNISLPPGISNLFDLKDNLSYEQIDYCMKNGTLCAAIENGLCYPVPNPDNLQSFSNDVLIRKPLNIQILPSRARFTVVKNNETSVFDEDTTLFDEPLEKSARELEEEINASGQNIEKIEAIVKQADLVDKPIENRYVQPSIKDAEIQQKIKNDIMMGYLTCNGINDNGSRCMRQAKTGKSFCGLHKKQAK